MMIILGITLLFKVILFFIVSIQYRFILDGVFLILFIMFYDFKIKQIYYFLPTFVFSLLIFFLPILGQKNIYFLKFGSPYSFSNLFIQKVEEPKSIEYKLGNMPVNLVYSEKLSGVAKQPAVNITLLRMYYWQGLTPQLVNDKNKSEGFILIKNDEKMKRDLKFLIHKIAEYNKKKSVL